MKGKLIKAALIAHFTFFIFHFTFASASPLASTNDFYYTVPKTTNIFGRVMGENADYRLVRAEDVAFINEAWAERNALGHRYWLVDGEYVHGGPVVRRGGGGLTVDFWADATIGECVLETESMSDRLAEASGGAMTNIVIDAPWTGRLVKASMVTNQFAQLKKAKVLAAQATVTYTNENAIRVSKETVDGTLRYVSTNSVEGGSWSISGGGTKVGDGSIHWTEEEEPRPFWDDIVLQGHKYEGEVSGSVKMRLAIDVRNTNDWLRGESSPKVVESVHAYAAVKVTGSVSGHGYEYWTWEKSGENWHSDPTNSWSESWSTNATVLLDMGTACWVEAKDGKLVYEVSKGLMEVLNAAAGVAKGLSVEEVEAAAVVPELETVGRQEMSKALNIDIEAVYLVIRVKPVTSLPGW